MYRQMFTKQYRYNITHDQHIMLAEWKEHLTKFIQIDKWDVKNQFRGQLIL